MTAPSKIPPRDPKNADMAITALTAWGFTQAQQAYTFGYIMPKDQNPEDFRNTVITLENASFDVARRVEIVNRVRNRLVELHPNHERLQRNWLNLSRKMLNGRDIIGILRNGDRDSMEAVSRALTSFGPEK